MAIDALAERYGQLPSQIVQTATTFDLFIYNAAHDYRILQQRRANGEPEEIPLEELIKKREEYYADKNRHHR